MAARMHLSLHDARVRPDRADDLQALIDTLFARRHFDRAQAQQGAGQMWLKAELVQVQRARSSVYQTLSSRMDGPLLFPMGFLRIQDGRVDVISDAVPAVDPTALARVLSEFLQPGARITCTADDTTHRWRVAGVDDLHALRTADQS